MTQSIMTVDRSKQDVVSKLCGLAKRYPYVKRMIVFGSAASNTCSSSIDENIKLIRLLSGSGKNNNFYGPKDASNADLFLNNDSLSSFTFNSSYSLEYNINISISSSLFQNPTEAIIKISKK